MKTRILALTVTAALISAVAAFADTKTLTGKLSRTVGAAESKVTIKVKTNDRGVVTKVKSFELKNAQTYCYDEEANSLEPGPRVSASLGSFEVRKFKTSEKTIWTFSDQRSIDGVKHNINGDFATKRGNAVTGTISGPGSPQGCRVDAEYSAKK